MNKISGQTFRGQQVVLDNNEYVGCTFDSCTFVYSGVAAFGLSHNSISANCSFEFKDAAANTLTTMKAIYSMGQWGRQQIIATFQTIAPDQKKLN